MAINIDPGDGSGVADNVVITDAQGDQALVRDDGAISVEVLNARFGQILKQLEIMNFHLNQLTGANLDTADFEGD